MEQRAPDEEPQVDPHYLELVEGTRMPQAYLPAAMRGPRKRWIRVVATVVIVCFLATTAYGVWVTFGLTH